MLLHTSANGQPRTGANGPASEQIRRLVERLAFQANRTSKSRSPEAVHDLRVSIRRLEQALAVWKSQLPRKAVKKIRKQLKMVLSVAGTLRNHDVAAKILSRMRQPGAAALIRRVRTERKHLEASLLLVLKRLSLRTRVSKWCDDLRLSGREGFDNAALESVAPGALSRVAARFLRTGQEAAAQGSGKELHDFRIVAKKFRYTLELFLPVYGSIAEEALREIRSMQSVLGAMNDYRTVQIMAADAGAGRKLQEALKRPERRKTRQFRETWQQHFALSGSARWLETLSHGEEARPVRKPVRSSTSASKTLAARM